MRANCAMLACDRGLNRSKGHRMVQITMLKLVRLQENGPAQKRLEGHLRAAF